MPVSEPITLTLPNLHRLDGGKANLAITHAIKQAVSDIQDRPGDKAARAVHVILKMTPALEPDQAVLDTVEVQILVRTKIPDRQTTKYPMLPMANGQVGFQEHSPMDPRQQVMDFSPKPIRAEDEKVTHLPDEVEQI